MTKLRTLGLSVPVTEVLDPQLWRNRNAFGVQLGASQEAAPSLVRALCLERGDSTREGWAAAQEELGEQVDALPDPTIRWHLRAALSELEMKLGIPMGVVIVKGDPTGLGNESAEQALASEGLIRGKDYDKIESRRPFLRSDVSNWYALRLPSSVISVERVRAFYYGQLVWELSNARGNTEQIRLEWRKQGGVHILPTNFQGLVLNQAAGASGGNAYGAWWTLAFNNTPMPDFWCVDYTLGPRDEQTGQEGHIEVVLADWVYSIAGIKLLSMAGLARSRGLSSTSTSFDGFNKSVSLQASAIYGLNSALEHVLEENSKRIDWKAIKQYKKGLRVVPYGH